MSDPEIQSRDPYAVPTVGELSHQEAIVLLRQELHAERLRAAGLAAERDVAKRALDEATTTLDSKEAQLRLLRAREERLCTAMASAARLVNSAGVALALDVRRQLDSAKTPTVEEAAAGIRAGGG